MMKKSHDEGMDGEPEAARKRSLIKANLSMSKGASPFVLPRETSPWSPQEIETYL